LTVDKTQQRGILQRIIHASMESEHHNINGLDWTILGTCFAELSNRHDQRLEHLRLESLMKAGWLLSVVLILAGCQTTSPIAKSGALDNSSFMSMWSTYRHCETESDLDAMRLDAQKLQVVAHQPGIRTGHDVPLPRAIQHWVSEPANRLAVDPKAMAVACSLHTGQIALSAGRYELAGEMFQAVLSYPEHTYPYYVSQAREGLAQIVIDETNASDQTASSASLTTLLVSAAPEK
jgi:hypothetical protein